MERRKHQKRKNRTKKSFWLHRTSKFPFSIILFPMKSSCWKRNEREREKRLHLEFGSQSSKILLTIFDANNSIQEKFTTSKNIYLASPTWPIDVSVFDSFSLKKKSETQKQQHFNLNWSPQRQKEKNWYIKNVLVFPSMLFISLEFITAKHPISGFSVRRDGNSPTLPVSRKSYFSSNPKSNDGNVFRKHNPPFDRYTWNEWKCL